MQTMPLDYAQQLLEAQAVLQDYGVTGTLLTRYNIESVLKNPNRDFEDDDLVPGQEDSDLFDAYIVINGSWLLQIGFQTYQVLSLNLHTEYDWCHWVLSMVNIRSREWHSLSIQLLKG